MLGPGKNATCVKPSAPKSARSSSASAAWLRHASATAAALAWPGRCRRRSPERAATKPRWRCSNAPTRRRGLGTRASLPGPNFYVLATSRFLEALARSYPANCRLVLLRVATLVPDEIARPVLQRHRAVIAAWEPQYAAESGRCFGAGVAARAGGLGIFRVPPTRPGGVARPWQCVFQTYAGQTCRSIRRRWRGCLAPRPHSSTAPGSRRLPKQTSSSEIACRPEGLLAVLESCRPRRAWISCSRRGPNRGRASARHWRGRLEDAATRASFWGAACGTCCAMKKPKALQERILLE